MVEFITNQQVLYTAALLTYALTATALVLKTWRRLGSPRLSHYVQTGIQFGIATPVMILCMQGYLRMDLLFIALLHFLGLAVVFSIVKRFREEFRKLDTGTATGVIIPEIVDS